MLKILNSTNSVKNSNKCLSWDISPIKILLKIITDSLKSILDLIETTDSAFLINVYPYFSYLHILTKIISSIICCLPLEHPKGQKKALSHLSSPGLMKTKGLEILQSSISDYFTPMIDSQSIPFNSRKVINGQP